MAKTILGIDFGHSGLKIALVSGGVVKKFAVADMPENLYQNGRIVSVEAAGELLRDLMKENGIHCNAGAVVLSSSQVFVRDLVVPAMTHEQLMFNLPFEFKDYITTELKDYIYDYAVLPEVKEEETPLNDEDVEPARRGPSLHLMAAAAPKEMIEDYRAVLRKAGLRLQTAVPVSSCIPGLITGKSGDEEAEYCMMDCGSTGIRLVMFRGRSLTGDRILEGGIRSFEELLADEKSIDVHLAHTYLVKNHDNCQTDERLMDAYRSVAVDLMRTMNFYRFSNPDSHIDRVWICGGGASIKPFREAVEESLDIRILSPEELVPGVASEAAAELIIGAAAAALQ